MLDRYIGYLYQFVIGIYRFGKSDDFDIKIANRALFVAIFVFVLLSFDVNL